MAEREAFGDGPEITEEKNKGLKLKGSPSRFASEKQSKPSEDQFNKEIKDHQDKMTHIRSRTAELSIKLREAVKDKTLDANKSPQDKAKEKELTRSLCDLALHLNNDEGQPEGIGSVGLSQMTFNMIFILRDTINEIGFENYVLKKRLDQAYEELETLKKNNGK